MARDIEAEFVTDTIGIKKYVNPVDSKTTYSFKIYPVSEDLNANEYYNLVYEKIGTEWNEIIFFNTKESNPTDGGVLESSEMVYNRMSARAGYAVVVSYNVVCTNNAYCIKRGSCDGLTCETGECLQTTISYVWAGIADTCNGSGSSPPSSGYSSGEGGGNDSGIYIPNPYEGDAAIDNLDFLLAGQVVAFTSTLAPGLQDLIIEHNFIHSYLIDFCRKNGGRVGIQNRQQMVQALTNYHNFQLNSIYPNLTSISINRLNLWAFYSFLNNNPLNANVSAINDVKSDIQNLEFEIANTVVDCFYENSDDEDAVNFATNIIDIVEQLEFDSTLEQVNLVKVMSFTKQNNYYENPFDANFFQNVDSISSVNFMDPNMVLNFVRLFAAHYAIVKHENPNWKESKVFAQAWLDTSQFILDLAGLVPVIGEVADLTNGTIYLIQGNHTNALLSYGSAIPVAGWYTAGIKMAKRADGLKFLVVGTNNLINFGAASSAIFRAICGIAVGDATKQAHHIIPRGSAIIGHDAVQKAAQANISQGFHIDSALNGIPVATWRNQPNHNQYNNLIKSKLDAIPSNLTPNQTYAAVLNIINQAKQAIINNPNTHLNNLVF